MRVVQLLLVAVLIVAVLGCGKGGGSVTEAQLGISFYPGARVTNVETQEAVRSGGTVYIVEMKSSDSAEQVKAFYEQQYGPSFQRQSAALGQVHEIVVNQMTPDQKSIQIGSDGSGSTIRLQARVAN